MNPCLKARIQTAAARTLAVVATGVVSWYVAQPIAQRFEQTLSDPMQIGIGFVAALVALFVSKRALDFTQDCMTVPDSTLARTAVGPCRKKACSLRSSDNVPGAADKTCTSNDRSAKPEPGKHGCEARATTQSGLNATVADHASMKVSVSTDPQGATIVTVDIIGVSASRFKDKQSGLRKKIENVGGIKWENPRNLGESNRQMVGRITDNTRREAVIARLQGLASSI